MIFMSGQMEAGATVRKLASMILCQMIVGSFISIPQTIMSFSADYYEFLDNSLYNSP